MNNARLRPLVAKPRRDWKTTVVLVLTVVVVAMLAIGTPAAISSSNTGRKIQYTSDIQSCRSAAAADVTDKRNDVDQIRVVKDVLEISFLAAVTTGDRQSIGTLAPQFTGVSTRLTAAGVALDKSNALYQEAVRLSLSNPKRFLHMCQEAQ